VSVEAEAAAEARGCGRGCVVVGPAPGHTDQHSAAVSAWPPARLAGWLPLPAAARGGGSATQPQL